MEAGWYPDPLGRFEKRYHDGRAWTLAVSHHGRGLRDTIDDERSAVMTTSITIVERDQLLGDQTDRRLDIAKLANFAKPSRRAVVLTFVLFVAALSLGLALGHRNHHDPLYKRSMVVSQVVVNRGSPDLEGVRAAVIEPGLTAQLAKEVAIECASDLGQGRANGALCFVFNSQTSFEAAQYDKSKGSMVYLCYAAEADYAPGEPVAVWFGNTGLDLTPDGLSTTGCVI